MSLPSISVKAALALYIMRLMSFSDASTKYAHKEQLSGIANAAVRHAQRGIIYPH